MIHIKGTDLDQVNTSKSGKILLAPKEYIGYYYNEIVVSVQ
jgi:hypothetical protein